jgi:vancomycin permeability regulator SanA
MEEPKHLNRLTIQIIKQKETNKMKTDNTYNGWTNYETWRVNLELFDGDNDRWSYGSPDAMQEFAELLIEESTDEGIGRDYAMAFLQNVDWQEIAEHYEVNEEVVA